MFGFPLKSRASAMMQIARLRDITIMLNDSTQNVTALLKGG